MNDLPQIPSFVQKKKKFNHFLIGFGLGLSTPFAFMVGYWLLVYSFMPFIPDYFNYHIMGKVLASLISLCVLPNLGIFYIFLNTERFRTGRGVIFSTILYGLLILYIKLYVEGSMFD